MNRSTKNSPTAKGRPALASGRLIAAALMLSLLGAACGGTSDPAKLTDNGYTLLGKSDWKGAQSEFDKALAGLKTTDAGYLRAKLGSVEALVHLDAAKAKDEFLATARGMSSQVKASDYIGIASRLAGEGKFMEGIEVLEAGLDAHPEEPKVRQVGEKIKELASKAGDSEAIAKLKSLGYL